jgi:hypothetical protein
MGIAGCPSMTRAIESGEFVGRQIHTAPLAIFVQITKDIGELQRTPRGAGWLDRGRFTAPPNRQTCETDRARNEVHIDFEIADVPDRLAIDIPLVARDLIPKVLGIDAKSPDRIR